MAKIKHARESKRQLGQFFTPVDVARRILDRQEIAATSRVLEPGFGGGAFLIPLIEKFLELHAGDFNAVMTLNVWGVELDPDTYKKTVSIIEARWGSLPSGHHLYCGDFLDPDYLSTFVEPGLFAEDGSFDLIIGNPPFGGTVSLQHQDVLERKYGRRNGQKIKRETYSLFIVKSIDLLKEGGAIEFICSDTFLTIPTMKGLRTTLMQEGTSEVVRLDEFSEETTYPMVVLRFVRGKTSESVLINHVSIPRAQIALTDNLSWQVSSTYAKFFGKSLLRDVLVASSGMTTGRNEYFVREIEAGCIYERYIFEFVGEPISVDREFARARLGKIAPRKLEELKRQEAIGATRRNVNILERDEPIRIELPHSDYRYYNKAQPGQFYVPARYAIYWKDNGDAVKTFKKNGSWYLHGVGGAPYFEREGLTWRLISSRLDMRYLPPGYILDSGAPCAFLRSDIDPDELWFILGWCNTPTCSEILKNVLNHTMNIQSKDVERIPYPWWVEAEEKKRSICMVRDIVSAAMKGIAPTAAVVSKLSELYQFTKDA